MSSLEDLYRDLSLALGDAVWAFARIEWITYDHIASHYSDSVDILIGEIGFTERAKILKRILRENKSKSASLDKAVSTINKAIKLGEDRNVFVHNPWKVWVDMEARELMTEIQNFSNPDKGLNLQKLKEFVASAEAIESELREVLHAL